MHATPDSHLDHGLSQEQVAYLLALFRERGHFFIETIVLPEHLGTVPCGLLGPATGSKVPDGVFRGRRGERAWESRLVRAEPVQTRLVTVVAGPHDGEPCILYTVYGGPQAPREPGDPGIRDEDERAISAAFWAAHALVAEV